jgi:hypothetical protein
MPHSFKLRVVPCLSVECRFWLEDSGWNGVVDQVGISVRADSFEQAKNDMELALGKLVESVLYQQRKPARAA